MWKILTSFFTSSFLLLSPSLSQACTVCFGGASGDLKRGFFWGVILLLSLPFTMAAIFVGVIVRSSRKNKSS
jgi:hypothetical protein